MFRTVNGNELQGLWGDSTTSHMTVDAVKHHLLVTMWEGKWTERLPVRVPDMSGAGYSISDSTVTKTGTGVVTAVIPIDPH